eukprot:TRINITY_DN1644_c0_g1_i7.p2 TRINITY_DN1644_c0_g1~~TRINITY_DN1644_c0_g1_i7.p2  ORF type:complete len:283 (+),score=59.08 TRINITY_DN1644_c0_g1_i7:42-851(+)
MVDLGVPTANLGKPFDERKRAGFVEPPQPHYPNVAYSKFDPQGALVIYRQIISKEDDIHARITTKYQERSGLRVPPVPNPPQRTTPEAERGSSDGAPLDVSQFGIQPGSSAAREFIRCIDDKRKKIGPHDRKPFPETVAHRVGWPLATASDAYRSQPLPVTEGCADTQYAWLRSSLKRGEERRRSQSEARLAKVKSNIERTMSANRKYAYGGEQQTMHSYPVSETDATHFRNYFVKSMKVELHKSNPKPDKVILKVPGTSGNLCDPWKP